jgi:hypothetical protein
MPPLGVDHNMKWEQWNRNYAAVVSFAKEHGHLRLPTSNHETRRLANWLRLQSSPYRENIPSCQREKLKALERYRDMQTRKEKESKVWNEMYKKLNTFHEANGHFMVPITGDKTLHKWILYQRTRLKQGLLPDERRLKLEEVDFEFERNAKHTETTFTDRQVKQWEEMYGQLAEFSRSHGHCRVPYHYDANRPLGNWVSKQRKDFNKGIMNPGRKERLDQWGFAWKIRKIIVGTPEL